jgi:hypothetical protein
VKDVVGPKGCVSIVEKGGGERAKDSADVDSHCQTNTLRVHREERGADDEFLHADQWIDMSEEPDHDGLCRREQELLLRAIAENLDLSEHLDDAVRSLGIVLAADRAFRSGQTIEL